MNVLAQNNPLSVPNPTVITPKPLFGPKILLYCQIPANTTKSAKNKNKKKHHICLYANIFSQTKQCILPKYDCTFPKYHSLSPKYYRIRPYYLCIFLNKRNAKYN